MVLWLLLASAAIGYLLGNFQTGLVVGWASRKIDLRMHGSGGTGATNALRTLGKGGALPLHGKSVRSYYRRQIRLAKEIKELLSGFGVTEDWFEKNLLAVPFIREEQKKVELRERLIGIEEEKENLAAKNGESDYYNLDNVYAGDDGVPFFTGFSSEDEKSFGTDSDPERLEKRNLFAAAEMLKIEEEKEKAKASAEINGSFADNCDELTNL